MASRRQFLQQAATTAVAVSSGSLFGRLLSAQAAATSDQTARIFVDSRRSISPLDRNLFGSFLEQLGRALGTRAPDHAAALHEYCNVDKGTQWSDLRRKHGQAEPYNVKYWCLGNEMDGPWQIGHVTATEYGMQAQDTARQMRYVDPS